MTNLKNANTYREIATLAIARKKELARLDAEMCFETVIAPELEKVAKDGYFSAIIDARDIMNYNERNTNLLEDVLLLLLDKGFEYNILPSEMMKITFS